MLLENLIYGIISAILLSILGFAKNRSTTGESFDIQALLVTVVFGAVVGILVTMSGFQPTNENIQNAFIEYAGLITVIQYMVKTIYRETKNKINK